MYFYRLRSAIFYICFCIAGLISVSEFSNAQVLAPPYFNLALNRRVFATATCGVPNPELYCKLNGADSAAILRHELLIQGQVIKLLRIQKQLLYYLIFLGYYIFFQLCSCAITVTLVIRKTIIHQRKQSMAWKLGGKVHHYREDHNIMK